MFSSSENNPTPGASQAPSPNSPPTYTIHPHHPLLPRTHDWTHHDPDFDPRSTDTRHPDTDSEPAWPESRRRSPSPTFTTWPDEERPASGFLPLGNRWPESRGRSPSLSLVTWGDDDAVQLEVSPGSLADLWPASRRRNLSPTFTTWGDAYDAVHRPTSPDRSARGVEYGRASAFFSPRASRPECRRRSPSPTFTAWPDEDAVPSRGGALFDLLDSSYGPYDIQTDTLSFMSRTYSEGMDLARPPEVKMPVPDPQPELSVGQLAENAASLLEVLGKRGEHDDAKSWEMINSTLSTILKIRSELRVRTARKKEGEKAPAPAQEGETMSADSSCVLCYRRSADTVFRPCGHLLLCSLCSDRCNIKDPGGNREWVASRCPVCREVIKDSMKTFRG